MNIQHIPVLLEEAIYYLNPHSKGIYADCTLGGGGHSERILNLIQPEGRLIGIDWDEKALELARERLARYAPQVILARGNFADIVDILGELKIAEVDGILLDLGLSSLQLDDEERGFSFRFESPLDMRQDMRKKLTAMDLVNELSHRELSRIISEYGEERWAKRIAKFIVEERARSPIRTTSQLVEVIKKAVPFGARPKKIHVATRTFQALRIAVNEELNSLQKGLEGGISLLKRGGRICVISYHSLEDRIVKTIFREASLRSSFNESFNPKLKILTKKPTTPSSEEIERNRRSRSAKLRAAERI